MENIYTVRDILKEGDYMGKVDLKDTYLSVKVHQEVFEIPVERKYLSIQSSSLWLSHSSRSVLQDYVGSNKSPTGEGSKSSAESRRHTGCSKLTQS